MAGSNAHITVLALNENGLNAPIKRHSGKLDRVKTHGCAVSKKPISHARIHKGSKQRDGERFVNQMESKNK